MNAKDLRIVFMGTPEFAVPSLRALVRSGYNVVGVVTTPDKPAGRGQKLHESDVKIAARELGLPILQPEKLRDPAFVSTMEELRPDLGIVIAFRMLPEVVWAMPRLGTFNLHASLLPQYRGAAPINWAIINGESKTGVTTFLLNHEIDKGAILGQVEMPIQPEDNVGTLYDRLMTVGADLVVQTVERIAAGEITPVVQSDEDTSLRPAPKIFKNDCLIDWTQSGKRIIDFIRGLSPYPAAWTELYREGSQMPQAAKIYSAAFELGQDFRSALRSRWSGSSMRHDRHRQPQIPADPMCGRLDRRPLAAIIRQETHGSARAAARIPRCKLLRLSIKRYLQSE